MKRLPKEVLSEVLACLMPVEIASLVSCNRDLCQLLTHTMGCVSNAMSFRQPVCAADWPTKYANHFLLEHVSGSTGSVTFRFSPLHYGTLLSRKVLLQTLAVVGEHAAALWMARHGHLKLPRAASTTLSLFRQLPWDFLLYTIVCQAVKRSTQPVVRLHIRSIPGVMDTDQHCLRTSSQAFLCNLLFHVGPKPIVLRMCGTSHDVVHSIPVTHQDLENEYSKVDAFWEQDAWPDGIQLYGQQEFRSSTVGLGMALGAAKANVEALDLSYYAFDEWGPSFDVAALRLWLSGPAHRLTRANFHGITFTSGADFCNLLRGLCGVRTLQSLRLSFVEYITEPPTDPLLLLFEQGMHLQDLRVANVMRSQSDLPFHALPLGQGYRSLGLSRMFVDTSSVHALTSVLPMIPSLVSLDLSSNGIDGAGLGLFAQVLRSPTCSLQRLKLSSNIITKICIPSFCEALRSNHSLLSLDLADNFLGTQSCLALLKAMLHPQNKCLRLLNMDCNQVCVSMDDLHRVMLSFSSIKSLKQVSLRANPLVVEKRQDLDKHKAFFADTFRVSFNF